MFVQITATSVAAKKPLPINIESVPPPNCDMLAQRNRHLGLKPEGANPRLNRYVLLCRLCRWIWATIAKASVATRANRFVINWVLGIHSGSSHKCNALKLSPAGSIQPLNSTSHQPRGHRLGVPPRWTWTPPACWQPM